jgi:hypothetical protein
VIELGVFIFLMGMGAACTFRTIVAKGAIEMWFWAIITLVLCCAAGWWAIAVT